MNVVWGTILVLLCMSGYQLALADDTVAIQPGAPFAIRFTAPNGDHDWAIKIRFLDPTTGHYSGETWSGTDWLGPSASWSSFRTVHPGQADIVTGKIDTLINPMTLQIVARDSVTGSEQIIVSQSVKALASQQFIRLSALGDGYFVVNENGVERLVPKLDEAPVIMVQTTDLSVGFIDLDGETVIAPRPFHLDGIGVHAINFNSEPPPAFTLDGPTALHPYETATWHISPATDSYSWYLNGEKVQASAASEFSHQFLTAGTYGLDVADNATNQIQHITVTVSSYGNIAITKIVPNPVGSDTGHEILTLVNRNPFPVSLTNWQLRLRGGATTIPLTISIPAQAERDITPDKHLLNQASQYDLYNESGQLVDTVWYPKPESGQVFVRDGLNWIAAPTPSMTNVTQVTTLRGTIQVLHGRALDLETDQGLIHVVIQKGEPSIHLHTHDEIEVTGTWQQSRDRRYLRVPPDQVKILKVFVKTTKKTAKKAETPHPTATKFSIPLPTVAKPAKSFHPAKFELPAWSNPSLPPDLLAALMTFGLILLLPSSRVRGGMT